MKKLFSLFLVTFLVLTAFAQEKIIYDAHAEKRTVTPFHAIRVSHGIDLLLKQGTEEALAISADKQEYEDAVKAEVVNGELLIYIEQRMEKWWQQLRKKGINVKAYVSFKNLDYINGSSGSKTTIDGKLTGSSLSVNLSSGASLTGELAVTKLETDQSSGAKSFLRGQVQDLSISTSSGAHFNGYGLTGEKVRADASSGGKIELSVNKELAASASSGGGIMYKGSGTSNLSTSSGGKIRKAG